MPHIPLIVSGDEIRNNGAMKNPPSAYNRDNYLDNYVRRTNSVLSYVVDQDWADTSSVVVFGHSQGAYVAIRTARNNSWITDLGLSAFNPFGRMYGQVAELRAREISGRTPSRPVQNHVGVLYDRWEHIVQNKEDNTQEEGDTFRATYSFSQNFLEDLLNIEIPIKIMYGSKDLRSLSCDYLPIAFERAGKTKYQVSVFPGLGHNYEVVDDRGQSNYEKMFWQEAIDGFVGWIEDLD